MKLKFESRFPGEISITSHVRETCKISCMKRDASPGSMHDTGCLGLEHWDDPEACMVWGGRREEGSGWRTHVYLWRIHFDIWQNQYNILKFKNKIKI